MKKNGLLFIWLVGVIFLLSFIFYQGVSARTGDPVMEGVNLFPVRTGATPTAQGQAEYDDGTSVFVVGDGVQGRAYPSSDPWRVVIPSPESQPNPRAIPIPPAENGLTYYVTRATFWATQSGCSIIGVSRTPVGDELGSTTWSIDNTTALWTDVSLSDGGVSHYYTAFLAGTTPIPSGSALIINWGDASTADFAGFTFDGYWGVQ